MNKTTEGDNMTTTPRPYVSNKHLHAIITEDIGSIEVWPQEADRVYFDIAKANHLPANLPTSDSGSTVVDIGRGVKIRASGSAYLQAGGTWSVVGQWFPTQYPSGRELTRAQDERARKIVGEIITEWARTHEGDIAQADDIYRNNAARGLEEKILKHQEALDILQTQLLACEDGYDFTEYPDLPTKGR